MANGATPLSAKTALVTGAARRLGAATALALARHGVNVVVHYRSSASEAEQVADAVRRLGPKAWTCPADLAHGEEAGRLFAQARDLAGPIDLLVNNAGIFAAGGLTEFTPDELHANVDVNAMAPLLLAREFAGQGREGVIVNFLDARVVDYDGAHVAYHLSKRMLFSLTRMMALEFAPRVRVNAVAPGLILPPEGEDAAYLERMASTNPLNRHGDAAHVTEAVLFLLRNDFVTGQVVFVDGGRHLRGSLYGV